MKNSNELFFDPSTQVKGLKPKLMMAFTGAFAKLSDKGSAEFALKYLFKPYSRRNYDFRTKKKVSKTHRLKTTAGHIALHHFKGTKNKHVLLSHGWADTSVRFTHLIDHLLLEGFDVWALDQMGHGKSDGDTAHLFGFVDSVKECLKFIEYQGHEVVSLIGHSMGALAVLNQTEPHLKNKRIVMISAPTKFFENLFINTKKLGVSNRMLLNALEYVSDVYEVHWSELSIKKHIHKIGPHFLMIHDKGDRTCSYQNFKEMVEHTNHDFMTTETLGHLKILRDKVVHKRISDFISMI
jgi:esterase/lipase